MKYKKIFIFLILILITIPICMYISGIIHFSLTNQFTTIGELKFDTVLQSVGKDQEHLKIFILLFSLTTLFLFLVTFVTRDNIYASQENRITDNIRTPIRTGQG